MRLRHRLTIGNPLGPDAVAAGGLLGLGLALLFLGYLMAFAATLDQPFVRSVGFAAVNTLGAGVAGLLFQPVLNRLVVGRRAPRLVWLHPLLAAAFSITWYFCTLAGYALSPDWLDRGLKAAPFAQGALSWQIFQGVTIYAVLALFTAWRAAARELEALRRSSTVTSPPATARPSEAAKPPLSASLLIRCDKEVVPILANDLIRITGADGYSEVVTRQRRILSTTPLSRFDEMLQPDQFVRAHRSHIVRLGAVAHAEPAGNARMLLHLEDGERIMTSRAGAKRLRELTV